MDTNTNYTKPNPLGIRPEWAWREERCAEIMDGIRRYMESGQSIPEEWQSELSVHIDWHNNRRRGMQSKSNDAVSFQKTI